MLISVLFCWSLGLVYAVNEDGYNYIVPSVLFSESYSPPELQCSEGYSGQYPNCVPSQISQYLPPKQPPPRQYLAPTAPLSQYLPPTQPPPPQCPIGSFGQFPYCRPPVPLPTPVHPKQEDRKYVPPALIQCPPGTIGSVGNFPNCQIIPTTPPPQCPLGTIDYYPNCQLEPTPPPSITPTPQCPFGSVGQFPDCKQPPQNTCPFGTIGYYPFCVPPTVSTAPPIITPTPRLPPQCPFGSTGKFPYCKMVTPPRKYIPGSISSDIESTPSELSSCIIGWEEYKTRFNKSYGINEEVNRQNLFLEDQKLIETHNALYLEGKETYALCVNEYSDWTIKEYESILGLDFIELPFTPDPNDPNYPNDNDNNVDNPDDPGYVYDGPFVKIPPVTSRYSQPQAAAGEGGLGGTGDIQIPDEKDWRNDGAVTPIKNQGRCASCWAFSANAALESHFFIKKRSLQSLSEQELIDCTKKLGNHGCDKGFMHTAFTYTQSNGISGDREYPYEATDETLCRDSSKVLKNSRYINVTSGNEILLKEAVYMHGPVSAGMYSLDRRFKAYKRGVYHNPQCSRRINHAVLIIGYGYDRKEDLPYWIIKNSFGTDWGVGGYARIARDKNNHCGIATLASYPIFE